MAEKKNSEVAPNMQDSGFQRQVTAAVGIWLAHDKHPLYLQSDYMALSVYYWVHSATVKAGYRPKTLAFPDVVLYANQGFERLDPLRRKTLLMREDLCDMCQSSRPWLLRQLMWCVECSRHVCLRHYLALPTNRFGDALCQCGGLLVGPALLSRSLHARRSKQTTNPEN